MARGQRGTLRADAERNRERILESAQILIGAQGIQVPLEDVARHAEVGIGTLYRRFPTRADLISAIAERTFGGWADAIEDALDHDSDPWEAFCAVLRDGFKRQAEDAGTRQIMTMNFPESSPAHAQRERAITGMSTLIDRARDQGTLRADFVIGDLMLMLLAHNGVIAGTNGALPALTDRLLAYFLESFRARGAGALPPGPSLVALDSTLVRLGKAAEES
jgi:AcrR family transcriptional regulator